MVERSIDGEGRYSLVPWNDEGIASFEAIGPDRRTALEVGLRAALALVLDTAGADREGNASRAVPLRGEGDDLAKLFADLLDDVIVQIEEYGTGLRDVAIDGLLRRDRGGFIAWGYAAIEDESASAPNVIPPRLHGVPDVIEDRSSGIVVRAMLIRRWEV
jgi:hypothetical protein